MSRTLAARLEKSDRLVVGPSEQLHELGAGDVEPFGHLRVHRGVGVHVLAGELLEPLADPLGRDDEQREHDECQQRQPPLESQHRDQRRRQYDDVADDTAERAGDRVLRADHVTVEAAGQRAGLGTCKERDRHALDLAEQRHAQVVDQALTDPSRTPALNDRQRRIDEGRDDDHRGEQRDQLLVLVGDRVVEDRAEGERGNEFQQRARRRSSRGTGR